MRRRKLFQPTTFLTTKLLPTISLFASALFATLLLSSSSNASTTDKNSSAMSKPCLTAVEAAALSAASDLSKIVVKDSAFGMVGLADYHAPKAASVHSINTILGTIRLDMIVADRLDQRVLKDLAEHDLRCALAANNRLIVSLGTAIKPNGRGLDRDGRTITPYASALRAYKNQSFSKDPESLLLSLGCNKDGTTTVPIPKPEASAPVSDSQRSEGFYRPYVNAPYGNANFVFGSIGKSVCLLDHRKWTAKVMGLPYQIPTVVKAEALLRPPRKGNADSKKVTVVACAQPANAEKLLATKASISIDFPGGGIDKIKFPKDLYSTNATQKATNPITPNKANTGQVWSSVFYDWMRLGGPGVNVDDLVKMHNTPLNTVPAQPKKLRAPLLTGGPYVPTGTIPTGITHTFRLEPDGSITYRSKVSLDQMSSPSLADASTFGITLFPALSSGRAAKDALRSVFDSRLEVEPRVSEHVRAKQNVSAANGVAPPKNLVRSSPGDKSTEAEVAKQMHDGSSNFRKVCLLQEKEGLWKHINWMPNIQAAVKKATRENKPVLVVMVVRHMACKGVPDV